MQVRLQLRRTDCGGGGTQLGGGASAQEAYGKPEDGQSEGRGGALFLRHLCEFKQVNNDL